MCTGVEIALIASAIAATTTTAVSLSQANVAGKTQKSAAETAARQQEQAFAASQQAFAQLESEIPDPLAIQAQAKDEALKRRQRITQTILTSPVGIIGEPSISRKTLLGQ